MLDFDKFGPKRDIKDALSFDKYVLFGAGDSSDAVFRFLAAQGKQVIAYLDNDPGLHGRTRHGVGIHRPENVHSFLNDEVAIVISCCFQNDIARQLTDELKVSRRRIFSYISGMYHRHYTPELLEQNKDKIERLMLSLEDDESRNYLMGLMQFRWTMDPSFLRPNKKVAGHYSYTERIVGPKKGDMIIDCGAYDGDSARIFLDRLGGDCKIHAFEPFEPNFRKMKDWITAERLDGVIFPVMKAVGNSKEKKRIFFTRNDQDLGATTRQQSVEGESLEIEVDTLDNLFYGKEKVGFIKMDVEGVETEALLGARKIIEKDAPAMAITAYHRAEDLWEIPILINGMHRGYKIFAGHHPRCFYEVEYYFA